MIPVNFCQFITRFSYERIKYHSLKFAEVYGRSLNIYSWNERKIKQIINLGEDGIAPLEIRFLHDPLAAEGFVGCAVTSNVYRFYKAEDNSWKVEKVIQVPPKKVEGWGTPQISGTTEFSFFYF